jgi:hypothetical protein
LENGNHDAQEKFCEMFYFFNNSDNLFAYLKSMFSYDIYLYLKPEIDLKNDRFYMDLITNQLNFLQLLTEDHNTKLQLYLREQAKNKVSYNFITIIVDYMNMLFSKMNIIYEQNSLNIYFTHLYYQRFLSCLETLCEFLQGPCEKNQETLINSKIIEIFDKILRETEFKDVRSGKSDNLGKLDYLENIEYENIDYNETESEDEEAPKKFVQDKLFDKLSELEKSTLIYKIWLVLLAIIEGRKYKDEITKKIMRDFDYRLIYDKLTEIHLRIKKIYKNKILFFLYSQDLGPEDQDKIVVESGFNLYIFLSSLYTYETNEDSEFKRYFDFFDKEFDNNRHNLIDKNIINTKKAMLFFKQNCLRIEILKEDQIQRVYFPKLNFFKNLTYEMVREFRDTSNQTSAQTKLNGILSEYEPMYETLKQLYE